MHRNLTATLLCAALIPMMGADGSCGDPILENNGFDLWCGDQLCSWDVEAGQAIKIPTWHESDFGIELVGNSAAISQQTRIGSGIECLRVQAVANIEETAEVTVEVDFFDDGVVDAVERIPSSDWDPVTVLVTAPEIYQGARFRIRKLGSGVAQLAELVVESADKCVDPPPVIDERPLGAVCIDGAQCASGVCDFLGFFAGTCGECIDDVDCGDGVCGLTAPGSRVLSAYRACADAAADSIGALCAVDGECESGICEGVCAGCRTEAECGGSACVSQIVDVPEIAYLELGGACEGGAPGDPCTYDASCASGECAGPAPLKMCADDKRPCDTDDDCYGDTACVTVGTAGGTCR